MQNKNFSILYISIIINALLLILVGIFLGKIFMYFSVTISALWLNILKAAFIVSGLANIWLLFYARKKLF